MSKSKSVFLNDAPVSSLEENVLWPPDSEVMQRVAELVRIILHEEGMLTTAVHGSWGAGKTSFLRLVQRSVEESVKQGRGDNTQEIKFCWYNASTYQDVASPITTLALRIWNALGGEDPRKLDYVEQPLGALGDYMGELFGAAVPPAEVASPRAYELLEQLALRSGQLADYPVLLEQHLQTGGKESSCPCKLVLIVDDLDRCQPAFIGNLLDALQRLNSVSNLFILIGVDREVLLTAVRERYKAVMTVVRDEHLALEKYIQHAIDLPEMTPDLLTEYVQKCLDSRRGGDENAAENRILEAIREDAEYFVVGVRVRTPRTIKRSINAIYPALQARLMSNPGLPREDRQRVIKEQLLAYNWRPFYQRYLLPAIRSEKSEEYRIFYSLEEICTRYYSTKAAEESPELQRDRRKLFSLALELTQKRESVEDRELRIDDELATLLARKPFWFYGRAMTQSFSPISDIFLPLLDDKFTEFYVQSEQADAVGDGAASVQTAAQAYDLVRSNRPQFGKDVAKQLGNLGVNAERYKALELAERIWRLALEIDPEYPGTMQQFASYIIDNRPDLYGEAEEILSRLRSSGRDVDRPWRTLSLLAQLRKAQGRPLEEELLTELLASAQKATDERELGSILHGLIGANQSAEAWQIFVSALPRLPNPRSRYALQRMVADALAGRSEAENEFIAMDLYRQILAFPEAMDPGDEPHVMANYATLLYKHDYDDEAGCLWFRAFQSPGGRNRSGIRQAYSVYLLRAGRGDLGQRVVRGDPIDEMALIQSSKKLPDKFSSVDLPDALNPAGPNPLFRCRNGEAPAHADPTAVRPKPGTL